MYNENDDVTEMPITRALLRDLGYCGHYLHFHAGGRSGQSPILCMLEKRAGEMTQRDLQESFQIKSGSMSEVLAKLEAECLVERTRSDDDRRQMLVRLTSKGHEQAAEVMRERLIFEDAAFATLSDDEQNELLVLLEKVKSHWKELECRS